MKRTSNLCDALHKWVTSFDVRHFVKNYRTKLLSRPGGRFGRKEQARTKDAPHHRDGSLMIHQQSNGFMAASFFGSSGQCANK